VLFIQVWTDQKNVKPNPATANISTKEYFEREKQQTNLISGKAINDVIYLKIKLNFFFFFK
jgi:hypothetical protein